MKKYVLLIVLILFSLPALAQEKKIEKVKPKPKVNQTGEIKLDDLILQGMIEKPSVSIVPKRIEPDLEEVEFITRKFDRELKMVPEELFDIQLEKRKIQKIHDVDKILKKSRK